MATQQERDVSDLKLTELYSIANKFIIRRTNDLLSKYLPVKYEHIVFCKLSTLQLDLYNLFVNSKSVKKLLSGSGSQPLKAITMLKKLCNHPGLLNLPKDLEGSQEILPHNYSNQTVDAQLSGKMLVLERMLINIKNKTDDKIVLISNYTQTLDIFEKMCRSRSFQFLRLDGSMTISKRQQLVDKFNNPQGPEFVFLLSSKAGGCGLNLIGANRLVLFDPDWNPASDQQALARVWRDGQKKDCFIYRFIATGSIEEKIFQRQSHKQSLSSCVVDEEENVQRHFSSENLRQLFKLNGETMSETHDTYKCRRCLKGRQHQNATEPMSYGDSSSWDHFSELEWMKVYDTILREAGKGTASYAFQYKSQRLGT
ncbi:DNA-dependent ATPase protein rad54 [Basidiobolus ranarum]|uniref:DNA-dependent ATPase protein rad54 n=1 Tax=Basidiobolus ranarum TaxID=34480 RepID=A0ABR2VXJ4_9FUNG